MEAYIFFLGAQIPAGVPRQLELCAQLLALIVKGNTYSLFHVSCPFLQGNCKNFNSSSFGRVGEGGRGAEYTTSRQGLKRSTLIKDIHPT